MPVAGEKAPPHPEEHRAAMRLEGWKPALPLPTPRAGPTGLLRVRLMRRKRNTSSTQFAHSSLMLPVIVKLLLRRALLAVPLVLVVVTITFFFIRLAPGDPAAIMAGDAPTPEFLAQIRSEYGFDQPGRAQALTLPR